MRPVPMIRRVIPAVAKETMRTNGVIPRRPASRSVISTAAAANSLRPDALAAVAVSRLSKWAGVKLTLR